MTALLERIEVVNEKPLQARTAESVRIVATSLINGTTVDEACQKAGIKRSTYQTWRGKYRPFAVFADQLVERRLAAEHESHRVRKMVDKRVEGLVYDPTRDVPDRGTLKDFRLNYFGRPTPIHQAAPVKALQDRSNRNVFIFGPTGMGKDTLAGDYVAYEVAPDRAGFRAAWFMENDDFSRRRMRRLARYLTDPSVYEQAPARTPGARVPARSLIDDYGPFRWRAGMVDADGNEVERTAWTTQTMYFLQSVAPEADPNLWATGLGGATYGSRIDLAVISDPFTTENQASPTVRGDQYTFLEGTLDTRLDEDGRLVVIGTMLPVENNYERMLEAYVGDARVVSEEAIGPGVYTKYANGTAVVIVKAINVDAETGEESSYWEDRFPLDDHLVHRGRRIPVDELTDDEITEMGNDGAKRVVGLRTRRMRAPTSFKAMFQQERDRDATGDFTDEVLTLAKDPEREYGFYRPSEILVLGIDPARVYGAGYVVWAVDVRKGTFTVIDQQWYQNLGTTGIKRRLILEPLTKWNPLWLCYETNQHGAVLDDFTIQEAIKDFGVSVYPHNTNRQNRGAKAKRGPAEEDITVGSLASYMRTRLIRFPYKTAEDKRRTDQMVTQFKTWDARGETASRRTNRKRDPDDLAMAAWIGFTKARVIAESDRSKKQDASPRMVPRAIREKWDRRARMQQAKAAGEKRPTLRGDMSTPAELVDLFTQGGHT